MTKMTARMAALRDRRDYKAVAVFVTFEADTTADAIIDEFKGILPRKGTRFRKYHRLKVSRAPEQAGHNEARTQHNLHSDL